MKKNDKINTLCNRPIQKTLLYTTTLLLVMVCIMPLTRASTPLPPLQLPDTPVTMIVYNGTRSYFDIDLSGVPPGLDIDSGSYEGWCADLSVVMPRGKPLTVRLYHSYDPMLPSLVRQKNWHAINSVLNHKDGASKNDIQDAFWHILGYTSYSSLAPAAQMLVDHADDQFIPQPGELLAVLAEPIRNCSNPWPFQFAFLEVELPEEETSDDEPPAPPPKRISHGLHYNDLPPVADANGPYNGLSNVAIEFNGSASYDPDGMIILYRWDFGDGATAEEKIATHSYTHPGVYHISLTVRDNFGIQDTESTTVTVIQPNRPPVPIIIGLENGTTGTPYSYAFVAFDDDADDITYDIDWGDGTANTTASFPAGECFNLTHQWDHPGTYTITVTASDGLLTGVFGMDVTMQAALVVDNISVIGLALLALIALLAVLLYSKKNKK